MYNIYLKTNSVNITIKNNKKKVSKTIKQLMLVYGFTYNDIKVLCIKKRGDLKWKLKAY